MKSGAGDDPFADDADDEQEGTDTDPPATESVPETAEGTERSDEPSESTDGAGETATDSRPDEADIPWVLRRDSVKGERDHVHQFFLRDATARGERTLRSDVEARLDKEVSKLDLREAAYLVAMEHPDEVAETLREWGYDYL